MSGLALMLPEIYLGITLLGVLVGEIGYHGEKLRLIRTSALIGLATALLQAAISYGYGPTQLFGGAISVDGLTLFFKLASIALALIVIGVGAFLAEIPSSRGSEGCALIVGSALATCLLAGASDLLLIFLCLQLLALQTSFLAAMGKGVRRSAEAGFKHFVASLISSAFFILGAAILFGQTESMNLYEIHRKLAEAPLSREATTAVFVAFFASLSFLWAGFPSHWVGQDAVDGAPTPISAYLALAPRLAGLAVAVRILLVVFAAPAADAGRWIPLGPLAWEPIVALAAGVSLLTGSLLALRQTGAKRMIGYLMTAESGFLLLGILVLDTIGLAAVLFDLVALLFSVTGIYLVLCLVWDELQTDELSRLGDVFSRAMPECICLILFCASLVGIPPFPGFVAKFALIGAVVRHQWYALAFVAALCMAIGVGVFARFSFALVVGSMASRGAQPPSRSHLSWRRRRILLMLLLVPLLVVTAFAETALTWSSRSIHLIFW